VTQIKELFASDIDRKIEEVIKVDQDDAQIVKDEIGEYIATDSIRDFFRTVLDRYGETPNKPHEGVGVWVSGFFGSGKSSFAKFLGLAMENRDLLGTGAGELLAERIGDDTCSALLAGIREQIPTHAVIFDIAADKGVRSGSQTITELMYRLFLRSLGYAYDLDLSELEIGLEERSELDAFQAKYKEVYDKDWERERGKSAFAMQEASRVMHELEPATYATVDSWRESVKGRADISPSLLAERCVELLDRRRPGHSLVFIVDEVGQFVARDVQKMLDLQGVVQQLGVQGRGRMWLVVTSQEKLNELVGGLDDRKVELARLKDRFPTEVHLEPSDIAEVTGKRVLAKNAKAQPILGAQFKEHRGRLTDNTRLTASIELPELSADAFVDLYPLLPYHVELIINVVSGLRTAGGASKHVGGANRTIIKLAQQLLVAPQVNLGDAEVGELVRIDQIYDLVAGNIDSEIRQKISAIAGQVDHELAQPVAKAICLLFYSQSIHRTPENIAAALHPGIEADSQLSEVKKALQALEKALLIRHGDDGYRIPTPAEDDWEKQRTGLAPKPADTGRIHIDAVKHLWQPQPSGTLNDVRTFKAGLLIDGRPVVDGEVSVHLTLAEPEQAEADAAEARRRSQADQKSIYWTATLTDAIDRQTVELFRSREILSRKERGAQTKDETRLVAEEKRRQKRHEDELRRLLNEALLAGTAYFRGNDRGPDQSAKDAGRAASKLLGSALPDVFNRFPEAAARVAKKDLDALLKGEDLTGLTAVFSDLKLVREEGGNVVIDTESKPLAELLAKIEDRTSYGEIPTGKYLADEFAKEPFGWDFDVVRLLVVALVRAGKLQATSKGQLIDQATSLDARNAFPNNNLFRSAAFQPRHTEIDFKDVAAAGEHFKETFGKDVSELEFGAVAREIGTELDNHESGLRSAHTSLLQHDLPGVEILAAALDQVGVIRAGTSDVVIQTFNAAYKELKEAIKRAGELNGALSEAGLETVKRAHYALGTLWPLLEAEVDLSDEEREAAEALGDLLARETFFRDLADIDRETKCLEKGHQRRRDGASKARTEAYETALAELQSNPSWSELDGDQQQDVSATVEARCKPPAENASIPLLRAEAEACAQQLEQATTKMYEIIEGNRLARVSIASYFAGGVDSEEQLEAALKGLEEEIAKLIAEGKKVIVQ
jgi:hypothetical protein